MGHCSILLKETGVFEVNVSITHTHTQKTPTHTKKQQQQQQKPWSKCVLCGIEMATSQLQVNITMDTISYLVL